MATLPGFGKGKAEVNSTRASDSERLNLNRVLDKTSKNNTKDVQPTPNLGSSENIPHFEKSGVTTKTESQIIGYRMNKTTGSASFSPRFGDTSSMNNAKENDKFWKKSFAKRDRGNSNVVPSMLVDAKPNHHNPIIFNSPGKSENCEFSRPQIAVPPSKKNRILRSSRKYGGVGKKLDFVRSNYLGNCQDKTKVPVEHKNSGFDMSFKCGYGVGVQGPPGSQNSSLLGNNPARDRPYHQKLKHSEMPCKYFHKGIVCPFNTNGECKYSHEPLSQNSKEILDKITGKQGQTTRPSPATNYHVNTRNNILKRSIWTRSVATTTTVKQIEKVETTMKRGLSVTTRANSMQNKRMKYSLLEKEESDDEVIEVWRSSVTPKTKTEKEKKHNLDDSGFCSPEFDKDSVRNKVELKIKQSKVLKKEKYLDIDGIFALWRRILSPKLFKRTPNKGSFGHKPVLQNGIKLWKVFPIQGVPKSCDYRLQATPELITKDPRFGPRSHTGRIKLFQAALTWEVPSASAAYDLDKGKRSTALSYQQKSRSPFSQAQAKIRRRPDFRNRAKPRGNLTPNAKFISRTSGQALVNNIDDNWDEEVRLSIFRANLAPFGIDGKALTFWEKYQQNGFNWKGPLE